ncbi:sensor histidine kinase [Pelosinus sp. UFO1]|uniref:sensor histidine kinase n=1 Tax=Pelosinus sp. UFO1 TaxID=484770 RepID=UPI0004D19C06|nr:sensor histidine kinase [Pelosinus sp. UFO1]AIF50968.1 integral membrane sensor signal transduction histidine kinase [Pelosinus sp. UFO1]
MSVKVNHLKDELRRTFTLYALIPTFIISIFIFVLGFAYWNINVLERNQSRLNAACEMMSTLISGYMEKANDIAALCDINELRDNKSARVKMYEKFYQSTNNIGVHTDFYLFDEGMNRLISNQKQDPEFAELARSANWGIIGQIQRRPSVPIFTFVRSITSFGPQMDLVIGKAILEKGKITGYVLFVVPAAQLVSAVANPYVHIIVKDGYDYMPICTDEFFYTAMNKMKIEFKNADGYFSLADRKYYISRREILNGELTVFSLTSVGGIINQLTNALIILIGVLFILSLSIVISVKKQAEEKTKMIDQLVEAFSAVKDGNLDMRLTINTNNEFQIIGEAYNMMLSSLKELMQTNHEKARATVISEIKQLESQFNPHFLFNTLENVKFMIKLDPVAANKMIVSLSNLLRYSINNNSSEVTIKEDMEYTQNYLDIQKYRFGQRLNYILDIPEEINNCIVPKLIIQPIIENAVKYGFRACQHMLVEIKISITLNQLAIIIANNGTEIDEQSLYEIREMLSSTSNCSQHTGLYNVNRRIQLMYGESYGLEIMSTRHEGTTVKIILPIHKKQ